MKYQPVIGLEVHVELYTKSKMFCRDLADYFGRKPNTRVCPVCLGLPGALPVANKQAIEWCVAIGLALNCQIPLLAKFDRKNYFYPDLPKGYQISQWDKPFCINGAITLSSGKKIRITRVHMEEDTGKLTHATIDGQKVSLVDYNRSGVPLVEIVTEPDFKNASDVVTYLKHLQQIVRYLGVSSADMEKGDMRLEPNISLRKVTKGSKDTNKLPPYKVEVKNINSFRFVQKAIEYEIKRQREILDRGEVPIQETRGFNEVKNITVSQREKEEARDYRYFPEPDIPPFKWTQKEIDELKNSQPELPDEKIERFKKQYQIPSYEIEILTRERKVADFYEEAVGVGKPQGVTSRQVSVVMINKKPNVERVLPAEFIKSIVLSSLRVKVTDEKELLKIINEIIDQNQKAVEDYRNGKQNAIMFLIGQAMRKLGPKADANSVKSFLEKKLKSKV